MKSNPITLRGHHLKELRRYAIERDRHGLDSKEGIERQEYGDRFADKAIEIFRQIASNPVQQVNLIDDPSELCSLCGKSNMYKEKNCRYIAQDTTIPKYFGLELGKHSAKEIINALKSKPRPKGFF